MKKFFNIFVVVAVITSVVLLKKYIDDIEL
jgi:hypothetical protein